MTRILKIIQDITALLQVVPADAVDAEALLNAWIAGNDDAQIVFDLKKLAQDVPAAKQAAETLLADLGL